MAAYPFSALVQIDVAQDQDWFDPFQILIPCDGGSVLVPVPGLIPVPASPMSLSGYVMQTVIAADYGSAQVIARVYPLILDASSGACAYSVSQAIVSGWAPGSYRFITRAVGARAIEIMRGVFNVHPRAF